MVDIITPIFIFVYNLNHCRFSNRVVGKIDRLHGRSGIVILLRHDVPKSALITPQIKYLRANTVKGDKVLIGVAVEVFNQRLCIIASGHLASEGRTGGPSVRRDFILIALQEFQRGPVQWALCDLQGITGMSLVRCYYCNDHSILHYLHTHTLICNYIVRR